MADAYQVIRDFEKAVAQYAGARYCVAVSSCTSALLLACAWYNRHWLARSTQAGFTGLDKRNQKRIHVEIPKRTYVGVPMSIIHAGGRPVFRNEEWKGVYVLEPMPVWDSARLFSANMYTGFIRNMLCVSFHCSKTLGLDYGGAILLDDEDAYDWLKRARFHSRREGIAPKDDTFDFIGFDCRMHPTTATLGLMRLPSLPKHNDPLPWGPGTNSDYPDLSTMECFK